MAVPIHFSIQNVYVSVFVLLVEVEVQKVKVVLFLLSTLADRYISLPYSEFVIIKELLSVCC